MILNPSLKPVLPMFEAEVWEFDKKIVAHCQCNYCGDKFTLSLNANPEGIKGLSHDQKVGLVFRAAGRRHSCADEACPSNPQETDRIVNTYHETKLRLVAKGLMDRFGRFLNAGKA